MTIEQRKRVWLFFFQFSLLVACALLMSWYVNRFGRYPWGSDTYGHLYKANLLYEEFQKGNWYVNYSAEWYNGFQPFRFWAPLSYYILAVLRMFTTDMIGAYQLFFIFLFIVGGLGWLLWGVYTKRQWLAFFISILWFFVPENLRILFAEGNVPFCTITSILPFLFLIFYRAVREKRIHLYIILSILMAIITLIHPMLTAMVGISFFLFCLIDSIVNKEMIHKFIVLIYAALGICLSGFWLFPALNGGIIGMDRDANLEVMALHSYPLTVSLHPFLRFNDIEMYYFGLSFALLALFGLLFGSKKQVTGFSVALLIMIGTTKLALPLLQNMPLVQVLWMRRFTAMAMAMILFSFLLWKNLRKSLMWMFILLLAVDSGASFYTVGFNREFPKGQAEDLDVAISAASQRISMLDNSEYGSFPSYYLSYHGKQNKVKDQVYGWAWQGATTTQNLVQINTALEHEYYDILFDRTLEAGADTFVLKKNFVKHPEEMKKWAKQVGYELIKETPSNYIYKYPIEGNFGTKVQYEGIAIGKYAPNITYMFPQLLIGDKMNIDDYTFSELKNYKVVYISGLAYKDKKAAEQLVKKLADSNIRVVIDTAGMTEPFLNVNVQPISLQGEYGELYYKDKKIKTKPFPKKSSDWRTNIISNTNNSESQLYVNKQILNYTSTSKNDNLIFMSLNIPYYTFLTKNEDTLQVLEDALQLKANTLPKREVVPVRLKRNHNEVIVDSEQVNVLVPVAAIDAFQTVEGKYEKMNQFMNVKTKHVKVHVGYPYMLQGVILSVSALCIICSLSYGMYRRQRREGEA
ncbi:6-pyruvoyl-tetrahydropterin synthase-related protein [Bacillus sp. S14(2024)]|uniref:6-pyruvoyl-tetrahydropterin synthase-related protein n=1 Tax=Bacillus sp. S14(2024) TaxID=3162884 RepID=UPI003D23E06A